MSHSEPLTEEELAEIDRVLDVVSFAAKTGDESGTLFPTVYMLAQYLERLIQALRLSQENEKRYREALEVTRVAMRDAAANVIAVEGSTDTPYPDDPRWSPWSRFLERALRRLSSAEEVSRQALQQTPDQEGS